MPSLSALRVEVEMAHRSSSSAISVEFHVAVMLLFMDGSSYFHPMILNGISRLIINDFFDVSMYSTLQAIPLPGIPKLELELNLSARVFKTARQNQNPINSCVGSHDGVAIKIQTLSPY